MRTIPQPGEVWFIDLGIVGKPRYALVLAARTDARLALASVVLLTTHFEGTPYEVTRPRVPWLREQCYINVQSIQPVKFTEFLRLAPGKFNVRVVSGAATHAGRAARPLPPACGVAIPSVTVWAGAVPGNHSVC